MVGAGHDRPWDWRAMSVRVRAARAHECPWDEQACEASNGGRATRNVSLCARFG